jgi:eukaryotic-like serine/threonine-protein kinase
MADRQLGPFLVHQKLGGGGMGVVYRATYTKTGQVVALKLLPGSMSENPRLVARFERELDILKKLRHPNIVPCFGGGKLNGQRFFAMELVEGGTLSAEMKKRGGKLPWEEAVRYGQQICAALGHAHEHAIIHRDLKPANLLISKEGKLKLADFGIARDIDATGLTATGRTVGTFAYMAPEQVRGSPPVTLKTDLYALGCVLFEMLTGRPPFGAETSAEIMFQHLEKIPPRVSTIVLDCPIWLDALIGQLLEKDPDKRPRDAAVVQQALIEIEQKVAVRAGMSLHAITGGPTALNVTGDTKQVQGLFKNNLFKKKKKKADTGPIWERTWFLFSCLAAVVLLFVWAMWPAGEDKLFARAQALMETDDTLSWRRAVEEPLAELQRRFPDGKHAEQVQHYVDKFEMHRAEERYKNHNRLGQEPANEGERLYAQAHQYERFGDLVTAYEKYTGMVEILKDKPELRPFLNLARRHISQIDLAAGHLDRRKIVDDSLTKAEDLYHEGKVLEARRIWNSIVSLYGSNRELGPQVRHARARLDDKEPPRREEPAEEDSEKE